MQPDPIEIALEIAEIFDNLQIRYFIGGSLASSVLGEPRTSHDIDLVAEIPDLKTNNLLTELKKNFYVPEDLARNAIREQKSFNVIHSKYSFKVDVFVLKNETFWKQELERRQKRKVTVEPKREIYFATPEDVVLAKLAWFRKGHEISERQWRDVLGVLKVQADRMDFIYLEKTAKELGIGDLLKKCLSEMK